MIIRNHSSELHNIDEHGRSAPVEMGRRVATPRSPSTAISAHDRLPPETRKALGGYLIGVLSISAATLVFGLLRRWLIPEQAFLLFLPIVLVIAVRYDFGASVFASILSFFCWDFFFVPPYYNLAISDPRNWLSLLVFLIAALCTANVASRARRQTADAESRAHESEILYRASEAVNREIDPARLLQTLTDNIVHVCSLSHCIVYAWRDPNKELTVEACSPQASAPTGNSDIQAIAEAVRDDRQPIGFRNDVGQWADELHALGLAAGAVDEQSRGIYVALHVRGMDLGVLHAGLPIGRTTFTPQEQRFILTLANHAAVVMARQATTEEAQQQARNNAVADERNRLARDVHDTLSHAFNGIKFLLEAAERVGSSERASECIAEARRLAQEGAVEARRSVWALRPAALETAGDLATAIWTMSKSITGELITAEISISGRPYQLPADVEENLFRIAQEAITNVVRHANGTRVAIELAFEPDCVLLRIEDDGAGLRSGKDSGGFGIKSMHQRTARIEGRLDIISTPGSGTRLELSVPIRPAADIQHNRWRRI